MHYRNALHSSRKQDLQPTMGQDIKAIYCCLLDEDIFNKEGTLWIQILPVMVALGPPGGQFALNSPCHRKFSYRLRPVYV